MQNVRQIKIQILNTKRVFEKCKIEWLRVLISWCIPVLNLLGTPTQPSLNQSILSSWLLLPAGDKFRWKFIHNLEKAILKWWALWKGTSGTKAILKTVGRAQFEVNLVSPGSVRNCCMLNSVCSYISQLKDVHRLVWPPHYWHQHFVSRTPLLPRDFPQNDPTRQTV